MFINTYAKAASHTSHQNHHFLSCT